jgi:hypothetical protein
MNQWPPFIEAEKIRWNEWLTHRCGDGFGAANRKALDDFCNSPDDQVNAQAKTLRARLNNPLRKLRVR